MAVSKWALPRPLRPLSTRQPAPGGALGSEGGAEQPGAEFGLEEEVEFREGVQDGEAGLADVEAQAGLAAMFGLGGGES